MERSTLLVTLLLGTEDGGGCFAAAGRAEGR